MTTPRDSSGAHRGRGDGTDETDPRHPGFDRYPPPNTARRPLPPLGAGQPPNRPLPPLGRVDQAPRQRPLIRKRAPRTGPRVDRPAATRPNTIPFETDAAPGQPAGDGPRRVPRKLTVTRVAALRGRQLTERGIATFQRAAKANGADESGLTALTYATMANFALDAAIAVALANTLFFA
ncbi:MFS transporter, partial [Nocardia sp. NPDC057353]